MLSIAQEKNHRETAVFLRRPSTAAAPKPVEPVSVLVADFENKTGDAVFDGALEQPLTIAMEGASFVTSYARSNALKIAQAQRLGNTSRLDDSYTRMHGTPYVMRRRILKAPSGLPCSPPPCAAPTESTVPPTTPHAATAYPDAPDTHKSTGLSSALWELQRRITASVTSAYDSG